MNQLKFGLFDPMKYALKALVINWRSLFKSIVFAIGGLLGTILIGSLFIMLITLPIWDDFLALMNYLDQDSIDSSSFMYGFINEHILYSIVVATVVISIALSAMNFFLPFIVTSLENYEGREITFVKMFSTLNCAPTILITNFILAMINLVIAILSLLWILIFAHHVIYSAKIFFIFLVVSLFFIGFMYLEFNARLLFTSYYIVDKKYGVIDAIRASYRTTRSAPWQFYGTLVIFGIFMALSTLILPMIINYVITFVWMYYVVFMYRALNYSADNLA